MYCTANKCRLTRERRLRFAKSRYLLYKEDDRRFPSVRLNSEHVLDCSASSTLAPFFPTDMSDLEDDAIQAAVQDDASDAEMDDTRQERQHKKKHRRREEDRDEDEEEEEDGDNDDDEDEDEEEDGEDAGEARGKKRRKVGNMGSAIVVAD